MQFSSFFNVIRSGRDFLFAAAAGDPFSLSLSLYTFFFSQGRTKEEGEEEEEDGFDGAFLVELFAPRGIRSACPSYMESEKFYWRIRIDSVRG